MLFRMIFIAIQCLILYPFIAYNNIIRKESNMCLSYYFSRDDEQKIIFLFHERVRYFIKRYRIFLSH